MQIQKIFFIIIATFFIAGLFYRCKHITRSTEENRMKRKKITLLIVAASMALTMFAGCSTAPKAARSFSASPQETSVAAFDGEYEEGIAAGKGGLGTQGVARGDSSGASRSNGAAAKAPASGSDQSQTNVDPSKGRLLIRNVSMSAETKDFDNVRKAVEDKIKELGGYIENSNVTGTGKTGSLRTASYTIRVSADGLDALISAVGSSCTVTGSSERTTDVTLQYVDTKARLESLKIEMQQLTELLSQAKDLDTIIVLQKRITEVRYEIESAESSLRVLENQVTYSTLTLKIREVIEIKPQEEPHVPTYGEKVKETFKNSLKNVGEFFKGLFLVIVALSPVLVGAIVIAAIVLAIVFGTRKSRRAKAAKLAASRADANAIPVQAVPVQFVPKAPVQAPVQAAPVKAASEDKAEKKEEKK